MRTILAFAAALVALSTPAFAQITVTHLQDIDVTGVDVTPTGITADSAGNAYVAGFDPRRVTKVANFASSTGAAASALFNSSATDSPAGPISWIPSTGLFTADFKEPNLLLVAGDQFTDGASLVIDTNTGSLLHAQAAQINAADRRVAGATWFGNHVVAQFQAGSNYWSLAADLQGFAAGEPAFYSGPTPSASRYIKHNGSGVLYISHNTAFVGDGLTAGINRIIGGGDPLTLNGATNESNWYSVAVPASGSVQGIDVATIGGTEYAILALREKAEIHFIPTTAAGVNANPASVIIVTDATAVFPGGVTVAEFGGSQYLLVSQWNLPTSPSAKVSVYGINGATLDPVTAAGEWNLYQ